MKSECNLLPTRWAHVCVYVYTCVRVRETDRQTHSGQANLQTKTEFKAQEIESIKINENQFAQQDTLLKWSSQEGMLMKI